ncbi:MAG: HlyD family efflux transporter periplasmic adaptor subunit [Thermoanaerobaculia bacterium]
MIRDTSFMDQPVERAKRLPRGLLLAVVVVALIAGGLAVKPLISRWAAAEQSIERARLRFATVTRGDLIHDVSVQGRVVAASRPTLFSPSAGIVSLRVREGERVSAGDVLAVVESPEITSRLLQEQASLDASGSDLSRLGLSVRQRNLINEQRVELLEVRVDAARRLVARNQKLADAGLVNEIDLESARDELRIQSLELDQARRTVGLEREMLEFEIRDAGLRRDRQQLMVRDVERQVGELTLRSPFDGLVATLSVEDRDAVVRGQALVGVVDLGELEVEVAIPESYADDVAAGVEAVVVVDGVDHRGTLTRVAPEVRNSQVEGRVAFDGGTPAGLRQNQRLATRLVLDRRSNALKVPRGPFLESGAGRRIYVVADGLARLREISVGAVSVTEIEILDGLEAGEEIVLSDLSRFEGVETLLLRN